MKEQRVLTISVSAVLFTKNIKMLKDLKGKVKFKIPN